MKSSSFEILLPPDRLPLDPATRDQVLQTYFADRVADSRAEPDGRWKVTVANPPTADFFIDPRLDEGLNWWNPAEAIADIGHSYRRDKGIFTALSDVWTLLSWSEWLASLAALPDHLTIIHLDDHDDLMSPRLVRRAQDFTDLLTGAEVALLDPNSVRDAITSGAIGMGSFIAPLIHSLPSVDIRHLCDTHYATLRSQEHRIQRVTVADELLQPGLLRPAVALSPTTSIGAAHGQTVGTYRAGNNARGLFAGIAEGPILLHIDLDFFNNRFDGDSAWLDRPNRHDPSAELIHGRVDSVLDALAPWQDRIVDITIGISAGFFPAEFWQPVCDALASGLASAPCLEKNRCL